MVMWADGFGSLQLGDAPPPDRVHEQVLVLELLGAHVGRDFPDCGDDRIRERVLVLDSHLVSRMPESELSAM